MSASSSEGRHALTASLSRDACAWTFLIITRHDHSINSENPLWVGSVLLYSEELYDFGPHELAAALSCLVADMSRPDLYVAVEASEKVSLFTINALDMQTRVVAAQLSHGIRCVQNVRCFQITHFPDHSAPALKDVVASSFDVPLDSSMAGLVEAWALGTPWSSILGDSVLY